MSEARKARPSEEVGVGGVSPLKGVSREDRAGFTGTRAPGSELGEPSGGRGGVWSWSRLQVLQGLRGAS